MAPEAVLIAVRIIGNVKSLYLHWPETNCERLARFDQRAQLLGRPRRQFRQQVVAESVQVEVIDPNLRCHQLVQQGAEEVTQSFDLFLMEFNSLINGPKISTYFFLLLKRGHRDFQSLHGMGRKIGLFHPFSGWIQLGPESFETRGNTERNSWLTFL